jgi:hypothetical protein
MVLQPSPELSSRTPRARPPLTVTVSDGIPLSPPSSGKVPYVLDSITPKTRRVSKLPVVEVTHFLTSHGCLLIMMLLDLLHLVPAEI